MATRSRIGLLLASGFVRSVYCHWDGGPGYVGRILYDHWRDPAKLAQLLDLGAVSILGEEIGERHDFDRHIAEHDRSWCLFYNRDRGDPPAQTDAQTALDLGGYYAQAASSGAEWVYLLAAGDWLCAEVNWRDRTARAIWQPLAEVLK